MPGQQDVGESEVSVTRAALAELMVHLRRAAVGGVVPESVFLAQARRLGLGEGERERLRGELLRLKVPVQRNVVHAGIDIPDVEKVARKRVEIVFPRLDRGMRLLERYADAEGYVTSRALEGVVRLAGLNSREAAALREARVGRPENPSVETTAGAALDEMGGEPEPATDARGVAEKSVGEPSTAEERASQAESGEPAEDFPLEPSELSEPSEAVVRTDADRAAAVAAARSVMREDRMRRRPENRLLTAQEEVGLAVLVRGGADEEPEQETLSALPSDDIRIRARDCLVVHNQRLVHSMVPRYLEQGLDYDDLFQHGALGLMRAARKFDPAKGFKFSTYATWWVRQSITRGIADEGAVIRIPVHMHEQIRRVANAERSLAAQGRPATAAEVAVLCDVSLSKVEEARRLSMRTDSLDRVIGDGATLGDFVARTRAVPSFEARVHDALLLADAMAVVDTFSGRDHRILVRRLGLDDEAPSTLDQLGSEFGVTRERIRQLEVKLLPALRERLRSARLLGGSASSVQENSGAKENSSAKRVSRTGRPARPVRAGTAPDLSVATLPSGRPPTESPVDREDGMATEMAASVDTPDWDRARRLAEEPSGQAWLANYALAAVGGSGLAEILGQPAADAVLRIAREHEPADHDVLAALEVLRRVCDGAAAFALRPQDFLDRPSEALCGVTPRAYLARKPLVHGEPRLAMRDALKEFLAAPQALPEAAPVAGEEEAPAQPEPAEEACVESGSVEEVLIEPEPAEEESAEKDHASAPLPRDESATAADEPATNVAESERSRTTVSALGKEDMPTRPQYTADWDKARELAPPPFGGGVAWLAEYALLAVGHLQLAVLLGSPAADAVVRAGRERGTLDRRVVKALEVLKSVFDALKELGLRPEHFFEWTSEALDRTTPRAYLAAKPLVANESRVDIRHALDEFATTRPAQRDADPETADAGTSEDARAVSVEGATAPVPEPAPHPVHSADVRTDQALPVEPPADLARLLAEARALHDAEIASLTQSHERRMADVQQAAEARVKDALAQTEQQLDSWQETLLNRADKALARQEQHLRRQADERVARLKEEQREANLAATRRAQERIVDLEIRLRHAETAASNVSAEQSSRAQARAEEAEQRLRVYRDAAEARIAQLEARLRQSETRLIARDRAMYEAGLRAATDVEQAQQRAEAAEQRAEALVTAANQREARAVQEQQLAAARLAQAEHDAWARISELQAQLAVLQAPAEGRASLRDRWRRS
ncbi:sigma-70 family RNA polymerase sigma factor [Streptomyces sp. WI03-4A]|uniref:sigma-70 family RNA polymerase sigma factor n=1 Tax=Streptomyces sp. WI03-4A TaxID=3028706 RepID=UPI0029BB1D0B|nr:sigma-70 family RNA polymerase sigma factor [Streptomyces sp. WI03-4A]MDX2592275.1 sigma-70 family RNA polymerase sigma factor [Streptomyces sp. WI03-4A]